jgi:hypothetical protein
MGKESMKKRMVSTIIKTLEWLVIDFETLFVIIFMGRLRPHANLIPAI